MLVNGMLNIRLGHTWTECRLIEEKQRKMKKKKKKSKSILVSVDSCPSVCVCASSHKWHHVGIQIE